MRVKKEKVKQLVLEFQRNSDVNLLKQIIEEISDMIHNYPTIYIFILFLIKLFPKETNTESPQTCSMYTHPN